MEFQILKLKVLKVFTSIYNCPILIFLFLIMNIKFKLNIWYK